MKKLRYFLENLILRSVAWLFPKLPRRFILAVCNLLGDLACHLDRRGHRTALENLELAFGDTLTASKKRQIARHSYRTFALTFLDLFWVPALTPENWRNYIRLDPCGEPAMAAAREKGSIWVTPHFGNFELFSLICGYLGFKFAVVTEDFKNEALTGLFRDLRGHSGHNVISNKGAMVRVLKLLKKQGHCAMLTDLTTPPSKNTAIIRCFGRLTCVTSMHVLLAQRTGVLILPGLCTPSADGRYDARTLTSIAIGESDSIPEATQKIWDLFEEEIRRRPECWLWMYKHWRFQPTKTPDSSYPSYARYAPTFETQAREQGLLPPFDDDRTS